MNTGPQDSDGAGPAPPVRNFSVSKKTVLLVDVNSITRDSRAKILRTLGVTVHCASSAGVARSKLESGTYNLVLVDLGQDSAGAEALVQEIKARNPRQLVGFLVGSPLFVATSLSGKQGRSPRVPQPVLAVVPKTNAADKSFDFAQKVRDAEAEEVA